jgi:uncharacterized protein
MHVYPTPRLVLPWYREPWLWFLLTGPFLVVVASMVTLWLAVVTADGLVADDYYGEGQAINQRLARESRARALGWTAQVSIRPSGRVELNLRGDPGARFPPSLVLYIAHPTLDGRDQRTILNHLTGGNYSGACAALLPGRWHLALEDSDHSWRLAGDWRGADADRSQPIGPLP